MGQLDLAYIGEVRRDWRGQCLLSHSIHEYYLVLRGSRVGTADLRQEKKLGLLPREKVPPHGGAVPLAFAITNSPD